jgi:predicted permease
MHSAQRLWMSLRGLLRRGRSARQLDDEMQFHLEQQIAENIAAGMSHDEARYAAMRTFGNPTVLKEQTRDSWGWVWLEQLAQDVRHGGRMLRKSPGFTTVAVLTLALGIGANTAIFSYIDAWLLKPLPFPQADRLIMFESHNKKNGWTSEAFTSAADFFDFQKQNSSFEQVVAWTGADLNLTGDGPPALVEGGRVSWNFFDALGAKPILGRTFTPDDDRSGAAHVAIVNEGLWTSRFARDPKIIGRNIMIAGEPCTVVGVMPATFQFTVMGVANLWTPLALIDKARAERGNSWLWTFGRLKIGITPEEAQAEATAIFAGLEKQFPDTNKDMTLLVEPLMDEIRRREGLPEVAMCLAIAGLVLLIACANVANLMLARAVSCTRELAVRGALGATRGRLVRQLLTESVLLFLLGGSAGALFGVWGVRWIELQIPNHIRGYIVNYGHVDLDFTIFAFTLGITLLSGLAFGLVPARQNSRFDLNQVLKDTSGQSSGGKRSARLRRILVTAEIALAVVVLISATLLTKSFILSVRSSPGYNPANILVAQLSLPKTKYAQEWRQRSFGEEVLARVRALPQVVSVGVASSVPYGGFGQGVEIEAVGKPTPQPGERQGSRIAAVSHDYFSTLQIALIQGRFFDPVDEQPGNSPSVIINQTFARQIWPDENPIGQQIRFGEQHTVGNIVGVVRDIKMYQLRPRPERQMYVPLAQSPSAMMGFVVRTAGDPQRAANAIRDTIWTVDKDQPISSVEPLETLISAEDSRNRILTDLMVFFGLLALFLGFIGIYGVTSDMVARRTHEIGIRTALGATSSQLLRMVVGQGLRLALIGVAVGIPCSLAAARAMATLLYQVTPRDPLTFIGVPILFTIVAAAACSIPARRATRVDPLSALRHE